MKLLIFSLFFYIPVCFAQQALPASDSAAFKKSMAAQKKVQTKTLEILKKESQKKLPLLLEHFTFKKVEGSDKGWYHHITKKDSSLSWIEAPVNASGYIYLKARYTGTVSYSIYSLSIKTEKGEVYAKPLTKDSPYIMRKKRGVKFDETIHLFSYQTAKQADLNSMYMLELIAKTDLKQKIVVKFIGEKENFEYQLSRENIIAIKESWELSQHLSYKTDNYQVFSGPFPYSSKTNFSAFLIPKEELTKDDMKGIERY